MAEVIGTVASIATLLELAVKISGYLGAIKDRHKDRDSLRQELSNITGVLFILKNQATSSQDNSDILQTLKMLDTPQGLLAQLKSLMALLEKKLAPGPGLKLITWPLRKEEAKDILNALGRQQNLLNLALQGDHIQLSQAIKSGIAEVSEQVADIGHKISEMSKDQRAQEATRQSEHEAQKRQAILDWLSPLNFQARQNDVFGRSQTGSGQWFLDCTEFNEWIRHTGAVLHCQGVPGAGKTYLASRIVRNLRDRFHHHIAPVACVYCDFQQSQVQTIESIVASILEQFVRGLNVTPQDLVDLYEQHASNKTRPTLDELEITIKKICKQVVRTYLVIDALDEYRDSLTIINMLNRLQYCGTNILITSRHSTSIDNRLREVVQVEIRAHEDDLVQYVEYRLPSLQCIQRRPDIQAEVTEGIVKASDGIFLLARLHFDSLLDRASPKAIKVAVKEMPKGLQTLSQVYDGVMDRIQDQTDYSRGQALTVLTWLFFARASLSILELQHALAIEPHTVEFDEDNVSDITSLVSVCKGLVSVDWESEVVRLSHYTIQEYFDQSNKPYLEHGERMIATACLTYLSYENLAEYRKGVFISTGADECTDLEDDVAIPRRNSSPTGQLSQRMPLFPYAAQNWGHHAVDIQNDIQDLVLAFLSATDTLAETLTYVEVVSPENTIVDLDNTRPVIQGIHLCAHFDLDTCFSALLEKGADPNAKDKFGRTPCYWATELPSINVIRLLLELPGIDLNTGPDGDWVRHSPIAVVAEYGHTNVMELLIDRSDIAFNTWNYQGRTPVLLAAYNGHTDVVRMLLGRQDVQPDVKDEYSRTALTMAAMQGHQKIVDLLLERDDIDVNVQDDNGRTAIVFAAEGGSDGHKAIVQLLLKRKDINTGLGDGIATLLTIAAAKDEIPMIRSLLQRGDVAINAIDYSGKTALMHAATNSNATVVKMLLAREDISTRVQSPLGQTALDYAIAQGNQCIIQLLMSAKDYKPQTCALRSTGLRLDKLTDRAQMVATMLSRKDFNPNAQMNNGITALHGAVATGDVELVNVLLMREDLDPNLRTTAGRTPLSFAAQLGYEAVVRVLLLREDINLALEDNEGRNAISYAAANGHDAVQKLLSSRNDVDRDVQG